MAVNLQKGQKISLVKEAGGNLTRVAMGLGWDVAQAPKSGGFLGGLFGGGGQSASVDLDASCLMFDQNKRVVDVVWFRQLTAKDGSVAHSGDNRTGAGDGDDEVITVDLSRVPEQVQTLVFTVNSFTGQNFSQVANAYCRLINVANSSDIARFNLSSQGSHSAMVMAKLYRHNGEWKMHAIGETAAGRTFDEIMPSVLPHI